MKRGSTTLIIVLSLIIILSVYALYIQDAFQSLRLSGNVVIEQGDTPEEGVLLGVIGDMLPSNSFSTQFMVVKYVDKEWMDDDCYSSALEACKKIFPGTTYVFESTEMASLDLWLFKSCIGGKLTPAYIYKDYCYSQGSAKTQENLTDYKSVCKKNYTAPWHRCPCKQDACTGTIKNCETKTSKILSWLMQEKLVKCRESCEIEKLGECGKGCSQDYIEVGKVQC
ncbi:hypothetical protein HZA33_04595 [Candidatus Pacearchaeota archaeon]|nr:hypothetical protein [Candidatus Pacearchaeota archaeon]